MWGGGKEEGEQTARAHGCMQHNAWLLLEILGKEGSSENANLYNFGQRESVGEKACRNIFQMLLF